MEPFLRNSPGSQDISYAVKLRNILEDFLLSYMEYETRFRLVLGDPEACIFYGNTEYYRKIFHGLESAKRVVQTFHGVFPPDSADLISSGKMDAHSLILSANLFTVAV
ncbi:MAG: hypothetical protein Q4C47_00945 [Planctomycetia bacterium]|nr:hypothetical protein [Planctomycetia bacterium]